MAIERFLSAASSSWERNLSQAAMKDLFHPREAAIWTLYFWRRRGHKICTHWMSFGSDRHRRWFSCGRSQKEIGRFPIFISYIRTLLRDGEKFQTGLFYCSLCCEIVLQFGRRRRKLFTQKLFDEWWWKIALGYRIPRNHIKLLKMDKLLHLVYTIR